jgi:hypothetical protein
MKECLKSKIVLSRLEDNPLKIWGCKIGFAFAEELPKEADAPLRDALNKAFYELTGHSADFCFSGWDGKLDEIEKEIVCEMANEKE